MANMGIAWRRRDSGLPWGLYLLTGALWLVLGWVVLRFDTASVAAVALLAGIVVLLAAAAEFLYAATFPTWRWLHVGLGVLFAIAGIIILVNPGSSFVWIAAFVGWYLLFKGFFDIVLSFATKAENEGWWLLLVAGIVEMLLGFWAAGHYVRSAALLIVWVAALCIIRGVSDIVMGFRVHKVNRVEQSDGQRTGMGPGMPTGPAPAV
jgi:uncharacterized membrane protein HdeD (DUF308 family)